MSAEEMVNAAKNSKLSDYKEMFNNEVKSRIAQKIEEERKNIVSGK